MSPWGTGDILRCLHGTQPSPRRNPPRRHLKGLRNLAGTVAPGDPIEPIVATMDDLARQAQLDYRAGGPVIEGDT